MPVKILKFNSDFVPLFISKIFNECIEAANFPDDLKLAHLIPVYNKINCNNQAKFLKNVFMGKFTKM